MGTLHQTVLLSEAVESLVTRRDGVYVDATFGRGGHTAAILECLESGGKLIAVDKDPQAITAAQQRFGSDRRFSIFHASFSELKKILQQQHLCGQVDGILLDLGVSSPQLDQAERGFSFLQDGPLDMRMDTQSGLTAREWIAVTPVDEMAQVFKEFGEERYARRIAQAIVRQRESAPIETTAQLAKIVTEANPAWEKHKHPATRVFQAIRIHINRELEDLKTLLADVVELLRIGGRLVVISFHSLEDRIVKHFIRDEARGYSAEERLPARLPLQHVAMDIRMKAIGKPLRASDAELDRNPRARSAILRVAERVA